MISAMAAETSSSSRGDQPRPHLDDGDLAPEAAKHLAEFETDIAAADDHQMLRQKIDIHHRAVGEIGHLIQPRRSAGREARPPTLMKIFSAPRTSSPTWTSRGETKRPWP